MCIRDSPRAVRGRPDTEVHHGEEDPRAANQTQRNGAHYWRLAKALHQQPIKSKPHLLRVISVWRRTVRTVGTTRPATGIGTTRPIGTRTSVSAPPCRFYVIRGYGFERVSLLYFKGEVILRLV